MKKIYLTMVVLCGAAVLAHAQTEVSLGYSLAAPMQKMADNIGLTHSANIGGMYAIPATRGRLAFGVDAGVGNYASITREQTFIFGNGTSTRTFVNYTSNVWNAAAGARFTLLRKGAVLPFVTVKAGYQQFYSNVFVEDPADPEGCRALDRKSILKDGTATFAYGGGLRAELSRIFKGVVPGRNFIELSVTQVRGGNIEYINTRKLKDKAPAADDPDVIKRSLNMRFINASTQNIHEHQVAEVYTTPLRQLDFRLTYVFRFCR